MLTEKENYEWENSNREKNIESWFSSVIVFEDGFHKIAFLSPSETTQNF